jgi:hypothetical protein
LSGLRFDSREKVSALGINIDPKAG